MVMLMAARYIQKEGVAMKSKNWNFLLYIHGALLLWFVLFIISLLIPDGSKATSILAVGNVFFLLANIPLAVLSFILNAKDRFSIACKTPIVVLSILNIIVGILMWLFVVMLMQKP